MNYFKGKKNPDQVLTLQNKHLFLHDNHSNNSLLVKNHCNE